VGIAVVVASSSLLLVRAGTVASAAPSERPPVLAALSRHADRWRAPLFTGSLVIPIAAMIQMSIGELRMPFADARHVAEVIRAKGLDRAPIVTLLRSDGQAVAAFLDREIIFPLEGARGTFVVWGTGSPYRVTVQAVDSAVTALLARGECRVVVISSPTRDVLTSTAARARMIYTTSGRPLSADRYRVWVASSPDTTRCPPGHYPSRPSASVHQSNPTS